MQSSALFRYILRRVLQAIPVIVLLLVGLMFVGQVNSFSEVPMASYVLVGVAPLVGLVELGGEGGGGALRGDRRVQVDRGATAAAALADVVLALREASGIQHGGTGYRGPAPAAASARSPARIGPAPVDAGGASR